MIKYLFDFATWLAGADRNVLRQCTQHEHKRIANLGALILVPSITGTISMSYAVSTFNNKPEIFISLGLIWGFMVLVIDRYIVSTFKKEEKYNTEIKSAKFIVRLIFAVGVGITVSHPLVLFIFNDTIIQERAKEKKEEFDKLRLEATNEKSNASKYLRERIAYRDSLDKILQAEQSGGKLFDKNGVQITSGISGSGSRATSLKQQISQTSSEISGYQSKANAEDIVIDNSKHNDSLLLASVMSDDYITKVNTLSRIESQPNKGHITWVRFFLLIFFIFLDIIPITLKVFTDAKEYDIKLQETEKKEIEVFKLQVKKDEDFEKNLATQLFEARNGKLNEVIEKFDTFLVDDFLDNIKEEFSSSKYYRQNKSADEYQKEKNENNEDDKKKKESDAKKNSEDKSFLDQFWALLSDYKKEIIETFGLAVGGLLFAIINGQWTFTSVGISAVYVMNFLINRFSKKYAGKYNDFFGDKEN